MKKGFYAYIRTSTVKQGTEGVSLEVQRDQANRLAREKGIEVTKLFSEMETAAKQGRPIFAQMMRELRAGEAEGLILHKIDRGARNLREWSDITDLIELGVKVYFVQDSIDLDTRGGRLTGDMLAAVAADYIRNLREETKKGIVGRLKQGLWPFGAPLGYVNNGKGKPKTIDPVSGPLVRQAFELYATGQYTLQSLRRRLFELGLRTSTGKPIAKNALTAILNNHFYYGLLKLRSTQETFPGVHDQLIPKSLYDRVQDVLLGRFRRKPGRHYFLYRGDISCVQCGYRLIGEKQKGHNYYRCHSKQCAGTSFREERVDKALETDLWYLQKFVDTYPQLEVALMQAIENRRADHEATARALLLKRTRLDERLSAATDAVIDGIIDRDTFIAKKSELLEARTAVNESIARCERGELPAGSLAEYYLELAELLRRKAFLQSPHEARQMVRFASSNFRANGKTVALQWALGFEHVLEHAKQLSCAHARDKPRTIRRFTKLLMGEDNVPTSPRPTRQSRCSPGRGRSPSLGRKLIAKHRTRRCLA